MTNKTYHKRQSMKYRITGYFRVTKFSQFCLIKKHDGYFLWTLIFQLTSIPQKIDVSSIDQLCGKKNIQSKYLKCKGIKDTTKASKSA